jgi:tetratricopeptide (TPR) repeat protein
VIKIYIAAISISLLGSLVLAQEHAMRSAEKPMQLMPDMGDLHHPIATTNAEAQRFFDQGLTLIYAFNHEDAARSFRRAAELDPKSPMPWWGVAMSAGPNYNLDVDAEREQVAYGAIQKARELARNAPPVEQAYCEALAARFSNDAKPNYHQLAVAYSHAMRKLADRYSDDPDAVTLYAESLMDLHPWQLWTNDAKPAADTEEIVARLEAVLRNYPNHIGANHFYIHAVEASPHPERALPSANRLGAMVPSAGHLVHMPSHIYARTGDYQQAAAANIAAVKADTAYVAATATQGSIYDMMYFSHNVHFLAQACSMEGNSGCAIENANFLADHVSSGVKQMPMLESFMTWQPFMLARFARWDEILKQPLPDASLQVTSLAWHYARGLAYASQGVPQKLAVERQQFADGYAKLPPGTPFGVLSSAQDVFAIALELLDGKAAALAGDTAGAMAHYRKAVSLQDQINYDEPPDWYYPVRETLGAALLQNADARGAETVFREDLARNPRNGRSLYGLWKALEQQERTSEAAWVKTQFDQAWSHADVQPELSAY